MFTATSIYSLYLSRANWSESCCPTPQKSLETKSFNDSLFLQIYSELVSQKPCLPLVSWLSELIANEACNDGDFSNKTVCRCMDIAARGNKSVPELDSPCVSKD